MEFDDGFDKEKSTKTKKERNIDFIEARAIWDDSTAVTQNAKHIDGELRWFTVGMMDKKLWVAIWTYRGGDKIRIISVRRAESTPFERAYYENQ